MTVLIGYVPTPAGEAALAHGLAEAALRGEDAVILNSPRSGSTVDAHLIDEEAKAALVERAREAGVTATVDHSEHGSHIGDAFEEVIKRTGASLVVLGLRRRTPLGKLVIGSDAQRLLLELDVPVLAVKPGR